MGLVIAFILRVVRYFLDGTSLMKGIDAPIFMSAIAIIIGLIYCEVNYWVKNLWIGAILFGGSLLGSLYVGIKKENT